MTATRRVVLLVAALLLVAPPVMAPALAQVAFGHGELDIETASGRHHFDIELATKDEQQIQGLMFRRTLAPDAGMLFLYPSEREIQMWMKNTVIPLDMIFIRADGTVSHIAERAVPRSLEIIPSEGPVLAVLEVNGGTAARLGIKPGDRVLYPAFAKP
ncbi:MAG TPA: DUF192 domain-containing protein [Candidatus Sulfotelmatobacter sp.]|nr:DUF192 domain-containing protein [Candidatus Sulfotelmatobacter sp.]